MTPKARAWKDLNDACKRLGWQARVHHTGEVQDGLVAGDAGYFELVTGAVDAVEAGGLRATGQLVQEGDEYSIIRAQPMCSSSRAEGLDDAL